MINIKADIKKLTSEISKRYKPEKIILFGSLVWGKATDDSDIDLFIIKKTQKKFGERIDEVNLIANKAKIFTAKDIIVFTPFELKKKIRFR
ncbi:MAG: nucleotidyltransferase domain-containing protein [bacterium]|nr:nucleotidyltransferase domain-containing protein [bacterium]